MIEHAVQNHLDPSAVGLLHEPGKEPVAGLQVLPVGSPDHIAARIPVVLRIRLHQTALIPYQNAEMGVNMLVILAVVLVIGGGDENRVEIDSLNPQALKVIQLIPYAL